MNGDFGSILRGLRKQAGLTQEALAHRSGLSVEGISALERGQRRSPRADTIDLLCTGLGLGEEARVALTGSATRTRRAVATVERVPRQLPGVAPLTGRDTELSRVVSLLTAGTEHGGPPVVAVVGMGGLGKTTLAVHAAAVVARDFPDGQLYLDLRGHDRQAPLSPHQAVTFLLGSLGVESNDVPAQLDHAAALFRSLVASSRMLLVLDNAADARQVEPLLPGARGCATIVTSRRAIDGRVRVDQLALDVLSDDDAARMLRDHVGAERCAAEPAALAELAGGCGGLPLAIRIVGARLVARPAWPLAHLAARLAQAHSRLSELCVGDLAVRSNIAVSFEQLECSGDPVDLLAARVHTLTGLLPVGLVSVPVASRLAEVPEHDARAALERLADVSLVDAVGPDRYRLHDLLHAVAQERAAALVPYDERLAALTRVLELYCAVAWRTRHLSRPWPDDLDASVVAASGALVDTDECLAFLSDDAAQLFALLQAAAGDPDLPGYLVTRLALGLITYFIMSVDTAGWPETLELALRTVPDGDVRERARVHDDLALAHSGRGDHQRALGHAVEAVALYHGVGDVRAEAMALGTRAIVLGRLERRREAMDIRRHALALSQSVGDERSVAAGWRDLGLLHARSGDVDEGIACQRRGLAIYRRLGVPRGVGMTLVNLGVLLRDTGQLEPARRCLEEGVSVFHGINDGAGETEALDELGYWHVVAGNPLVGLTILTDSLALNDSLAVDDRGPSQWEASIRRRLGLALDGLGRHAEAEVHWRAAMRIHERRGEWRSVAEVRELWRRRAGAVAAVTG